MIGVAGRRMAGASQRHFWALIGSLALGMLVRTAEGRRIDSREGVTLSTDVARHPPRRSRSVRDSSLMRKVDLALILMT